ncbi:DUF2513 domain-containing protein [Priestia megaterium]|uniref:DUF2513 domain-containing protein n=1 Tax=Priestia megaterium TaxID=1404 RepID=UPI001374D3EE|nr:DUF2513 domain-containing protein [Priestia megaterium]
MKRNKALMVQILLRLEENEKSQILINREDEPEMIDTLYFHVKLLGEAGYVTYDRVFADNKLKVFWARLTNKGYDYLEQVEAEQEDTSKLAEAKGLLTKGTQWTMTNIVSPIIVEYTNSLIFPSK